IAFFSPVPVITALLTFTAWRSLNRRTEIAPFASAVGLFLIAYLGIAISLWPMIVPYHYSLWEAASAQSTQAFLAIGTLFLLPVILMYTAWSYWVFSRQSSCGDRISLGTRIILGHLFSGMATGL